MATYLMLWGMLVKILLGEMRYERKWSSIHAAMWKTFNRIQHSSALNERPDAIEVRRAFIGLLTLAVSDFATPQVVLIFHARFVERILMGTSDTGWFLKELYVKYPRLVSPNIVLGQLIEAILIRAETDEGTGNITSADRVRLTNWVYKHPEDVAMALDGLDIDFDDERLAAVHHLWRSESPPIHGSA